MCGDGHFDSLWHSWIYLLQAKKVNIVIKIHPTTFLCFPVEKYLKAKTDIVFDLFLDVNSINVFLKTFVKTRICDLIGYKSVKQSPGERF